MQSMTLIGATSHSTTWIKNGLPLLIIKCTQISVLFYIEILKTGRQLCLLKLLTVYKK